MNICTVHVLCIQFSIFEYVSVGWISVLQYIYIYKCSSVGYEDGDDPDSRGVGMYTLRETRRCCLGTWMCNC